jgi:DNA-binding response OmpR family regulator
MANTILLVDDDPHLCRVVSMFFEIEGFVVLVAKDGNEALEQVGETRPDVILLDLMMADMDGVEVCRRIRLDRNLAEVPILVFTAAETREQEMEQAGADRYVVKPFSLDGLLATVNELIHARASAAPT